MVSRSPIPSPTLRYIEGCTPGHSTETVNRAYTQPDDAEEDADRTLLSTPPFNPHTPGPSVKSERYGSESIASPSPDGSDCAFIDLLSVDRSRPTRRKHFLKTEDFIDRISDCSGHEENQTML